MLAKTARFYAEHGTRASMAQRIISCENLPAVVVTGSNLSSLIPLCIYFQLVVEFTFAIFAGGGIRSDPKYARIRSFPLYQVWTTKGNLWPTTFLVAQPFKLRSAKACILGCPAYLSKERWVFCGMTRKSRNTASSSILD